MTSPEIGPLSVEAEPLLRPELDKAEQFIGMVCLSLNVEIELVREYIDEHVPEPSLADDKWPVYFLEGLHKAVLKNRDLQNWLSGYFDEVASRPASDQPILIQKLYVGLTEALGNGASDMRSPEVMVSHHQPNSRRTWPAFRRQA